MDWIRDHLWETLARAVDRAGRRRDVQPRPDPGDARRPVRWSAWSPRSIGASGGRPGPRLAGRLGRHARARAPGASSSGSTAVPSCSLGHGKLVGTRCLVTEEITGLDRGPDQGRRRDLDRPALRREPADRARARPSRSCRSRARPPTSTRWPRSSPEPPPPPPPHTHRGRPNADSLVGPVPAHRPVRRRPAPKTVKIVPAGTCRDRRAVRPVQGDAPRRASTSSCRSSTRCATSSTCASRS